MSSLPSEAGKSIFIDHQSLFNQEENDIGQILIQNDQAHLFAKWSSKDVASDLPLKKQFLHQVAEINGQYPGGIKAYIQRAKVLLKLAVTGANPYEGYSVSEPRDSVRLEKSEHFEHFESIGLKNIHETGFVIVAGGLGERLGYRGIKLAIPCDVVTGRSFLELYIQFILALQEQARKALNNNHFEIPFAIMTSDDTDKLTRELLNHHNNFGMSSNQLIIFKQGKVPSMIDNDGHFCNEETEPYKLDTKPHGHGDVHMLLYQYGIIDDFVSKRGVKWVTFFQDTNGLVFRAIPAALGVSISKNLHMNSLTVPRVQGDAVGAICTLIRDPNAKVDEHSLPSPLTINVEYNQLEGLLGKVKEPVVSGTNNSVYPGNINVLIFNAVQYNEVLKVKKGAISEFVNPKYNADKQSFKKPTRLECMMQDYPKLLDGSAAVGFSQFERWTSFSAVKNAIADGVAKQKSGNAPEVAATGEVDLYNWPFEILKELGVKLGSPLEKNFRGVIVNLPPRIVFYPSFGVTQKQVKDRFTNPSLVSISSKSTLILEGDIIIKSLQLDGTLVVKAAPGIQVLIDDLKVSNEGWTFQEIVDDSKVEQAMAIRGYINQKIDQQVFHIDSKVTNGKNTYTLTNKQ